MDFLIWSFDNSTSEIRNKTVFSGHDNSKPTKEVQSMNHSQCNKAIRCTVPQCANHCDSAEYCALDCITVGTHEANPTVDQCTDCKSFQRKC